MQLETLVYRDHKGESYRWEGAPTTYNRTCILGASNR